MLSLRPQIDHFWSRFDKSGPVPAHRPELGPCWLWTGARITAGYGHFYIGGEHFYAHRTSLELKLERPLIVGAQACHECDNPPCGRPEHLFEGTPKSKVVDMLAKGRHVSRTGDLSGSRLHPESRPRGSAAPAAKLNEAQVAAIRAMRRTGTIEREIAAAFGVSRSTVSHIVLGLNWKHLA